MGKKKQISILTRLVELLAISELRREKQLEDLKMELAELAATINNVNAQLGKATEEIVTKILALEEELMKSNQMTAEVETAVASLKASAQALDDLNPDPVVDPVPTEEPIPELILEEQVQ